MSLASLFTTEELERFYKHDRKVSRLAAAMSHPRPKVLGKPQYNFHQRGYIFGDFRCCCCLKWLNENIPKEQAEIHYGKGGHRYHRKCPVYSPYTATLIACPKFHGTRKKIVDEAKRY